MMKADSELKRSPLALQAGLYTLGLLEGPARQTFQDELAVSPAARARLDESEALVALIACRVGWKKPCQTVLVKALAQVGTPPVETPALRRQVRRKVFYLGHWGRAAVGMALLLGAGAGWRLVEQQRTISKLEQERIAKQNQLGLFPLSALAPSRATNLSTKELRELERKLAQQANNKDETARAGARSGDRSLLVPLNDAAHQRLAQGSRSPAGTSTQESSVDKRGVESVFVELIGPEEKPRADRGFLLGEMVSDKMTAAAAALDAPLERTTPSALIGSPAAAGAFELYGGVHELGQGILFSEDTGLLMVPRGDGRTYDYRNPGLGFDPSNLDEMRKQLAGEARRQIEQDSLASVLARQTAMLEPVAAGRPRAYVYADQQSGEGFVLVRRLPELAPQEVYRLYQNTASPELVGDLPPEEGGREEIVLKLPKPSSAGEGFLITREPAGVVGGPLGTIVLRGK